MKTRVMRAFTVALLGTFLAAAGCKESAQNSPSTVRIGVNAPLTGPIAAWGGQYGNGFSFGIEEAVKQYKLDPKIFAVDVQDNAGKPEQAVSIFNKQRAAGLDAYVSVATGPANAVAPQLDQMGTPHFIAAFDPFITKAGANRFRVMANSKVEGPLLANYVLGQHAKSAYIIQINFAYANEQVGSLIQPALEAKGVHVSRERFELEQRDFKIIAQKAKALNPDNIIIIGYSFHIQALLKDLRAQGLVKPGRIITSMDFVDLLISGAPTGELRGVVFDAPLFEIPGKVPQAAGWRARYKARFGVEPSYVPAYAYDTATLLVRAYAAKKSVNAASLLASVPFEGVSGPIKLDGDRDIEATTALATLDDTGHIVALSQPAAP